MNTKRQLADRSRLCLPTAQAFYFARINLNREASQFDFLPRSD
jgi:hypothetical protein